MIETITTIVAHPDMKPMYILAAGERWALWPAGGIVVTHPDRPPRHVGTDGTVTELQAAAERP